MTKRATSGKVPSRDSHALLSARQRPLRRCLTLKPLKSSKASRIALRESHLRIGSSGLKLSSRCNFRTKKFVNKLKLIANKSKQFAKKSKPIEMKSKPWSKARLTRFLLRSEVETTESQA